LGSSLSFVWTSLKHWGHDVVLRRCLVSLFLESHARRCLECGTHRSTLMNAAISGKELNQNKDLHIAVQEQSTYTNHGQTVGRSGRFLRKIRVVDVPLSAVLCLQRSPNSDSPLARGVDLEFEGTVLPGSAQCCCGPSI
jgi:hypothetical protein